MDVQNIIMDYGLIVSVIILMIMVEPRILRNAV